MGGLNIIFHPNKRHFISSSRVKEGKLFEVQCPRGRFTGCREVFITPWQIIILKHKPIFSDFFQIFQDFSKFFMIFLQIIQVFCEINQFLPNYSRFFFQFNQDHPLTKICRMNPAYFLPIGNLWNKQEWILNRFNVTDFCNVFLVSNLGWMAFSKKVLTIFLSLKTYFLILPCIFFKKTSPRFIKIIFSRMFP